MASTKNGQVTKPSALVLLVATDTFHRTLAEAAASGLGNKFDVTIVDLVADQFRPFMSAEERRAYHTNDPLLDPQVVEYAELVKRTSSLTFVLPIESWTVPPILKGWLERVMAPGIAFVFDQNHRVRPNLRDVASMVGIATYTQTKAEIAIAGDTARSLLLRAVRLNVPGRVRRRWHGLYEFGRAPAKAKDQFVNRVEAGARSL